MEVLKKRTFHKKTIEICKEITHPETQQLVRAPAADHVLDEHVT